MSKNPIRALWHHLERINHTKIIKIFGEILFLLEKTLMAPFIVTAFEAAKNIVTLYYSNQRTNSFEVYQPVKMSQK